MTVSEKTTEFSSEPEVSEGKGFDAPVVTSGSGAVEQSAAMSQEWLGSDGNGRQRRKPSASTRVKQTELVLFTIQLSVMLESGVVLSEALDAIGEQIEQSCPILSAIVVDVADKVKSGDNFSNSLASYPNVFNSMFVSMVRASEASGKMSEMLKILSGYLEFETETRSRVKSALTYPLIMSLMAMVSTVVLMFFVLPRFTKIYESRGAALPKLTQILVNFSNMLTDFKALTQIITVVVLVLASIYYWLGSRSGRRFIDFMKIRTPVLGTMYVDMLTTRSMKIMSTMVSTGVSLLDAIEVICGSCSNSYFQELWIQTSDRIRNGHQLSESLQISSQSDAAQANKAGDKKNSSRLFTEIFEGRAQLVAPGIVQMLRAGETSGKLGEVSAKISAFYEKRLESSIKRVTCLIEPMMIIILGGIIGTIAIALLLPVFKISTVVAQ